MKKGAFLFLADGIWLLMAYFAALALRQLSFAAQYLNQIGYSWPFLGLVFLLLIVTMYFAFSWFGLYRSLELEISARLFPFFQALFFWMLFLLAVDYFLKIDFSRAVFFSTFLFFGIGSAFTRMAFFQREKQLHNRNGLEIIVAGLGETSQDFVAYLRVIYPSIRSLVIGHREESKLRGIFAKEVFLTGDEMTKKDFLSVLADPAYKNLTFRPLKSFFSKDLSLAGTDGLPPFSVYRQPSLSYSLMKRSVDILAAVLGLGLGAPVFFAIAAVIKFDSVGPVFLKQTRVGKDGQPFFIWKFRTMRDDAELYAYAPKGRTDPRITKAGRILRRLSLDELPQLWNILKGEMSLVGPRPEMPFIVEKYENWQRVRLLAKPGLSGLWQIYGRKDLPLHDNLEYDFYYIANRSIFLDLTIIIKTLPAVLFGRGAY